jgi:hypothetical protein
VLSGGERQRERQEYREILNVDQYLI